MKHKTLHVTAPEKSNKITILERTKSAQWNQILSGILCVVGFLLIFSVTLYLSIKEEIESTNKNKYISRMHRFIKTNVEKCYVNATLFSIQCQDFEDGDNISQIVEYYIQKLPCWSEKNCIIILSLENFLPHPKSLLKGWLISDQYRIKELLLNSSNVHDIREDSFFGYVFERLASLEIMKVTIESLNADIFNGLSSLTKLEIRDSKVYKFERDALKHVASSLEILQIQNSQKWDPSYVTGQRFFPKLVTVDFRFNDFGDMLNHESFNGLTSCKQIFLVSSAITKLPCGTFQNMNKLESIYLNDNYLSEMQECVFGSQFDDSKIKVYVDNNQWRCDCELEWLKNLPPQGDPKCTSPKNFEGRSFDEINFCENISITVPSTSPTTTPTFSTDDVDACTEIPTTTPMDDCSIGSALDIRGIDFVIRDDGSNGVVINITSHIEKDDYLIWYLKKEKMNNKTCIDEKVFHIGGMEHSVAYTFCIIKKKITSIVYPNCVSHVIETPYKMKSWIMNKDKDFFIGMFGFSLLLSILFGAVLVFIIVRTYPTLLRGSKRIVVVNKKKNQVLVMPSGCENFTSRSSLENSSEFRTASTGERTLERSGFRRSPSNASMISGSYISPSEPTTIQLLNWRLDRLRSKQEQNVIPETPPPLPERNLSSRGSSSSFPADFDNFSELLTL